jgi:F-type H+-transporting ATPase subunit delta
LTDTGGNGGGGGGHGQGQAKDRVDGYARALLAVAEAEDLTERVGDELFHFARAVERHDQLRNTLTEEALSIEKRQEIVEELLGEKASPLTSSLVSFIIASGRAKNLSAIVDRMVELSAAARQHEVAEVRAAHPLDGDQKSRLSKALSSALGKEVEVKVIVDPSVLGGVIATVGDTVIDGSVRYRLEKLREVL